MLVITSNVKQVWAASIISSIKLHFKKLVVKWVTPKLGNVKVTNLILFVHRNSIFNYQSIAKRSQNPTMKAMMSLNPRTKN